MKALLLLALVSFEPSSDYIAGQCHMINSLLEHQKENQGFSGGLFVSSFYRQEIAKQGSFEDYLEWCMKHINIYKAD